MALFMRFPGGRAKALTLSYDDNVKQDFRMMEILDRHGLKCTFNINTGCFAQVSQPTRGRMTEAEAISLYKDSPHEIAVHTLTHPHLAELPDNAVAYEVMADIRNIERLFGRITRGMAYPSGSYNDQVVEVLRRCGIAYARTVISTERFDIPRDWLRLPTTCHHDNPRLNELADKFLAGNPPASPWLFYLWGHSYEFDNHNNWAVIEQFSEKMGGNPEIWYATNIEIYDYVHAYKRLIFSSDMHMVYNPTATELFFLLDKKAYSVKPSEKLVLADAAD